MKVYFPPTMDVEKYGLLMVKAFCGFKEKEKRFSYQIFYFHGQGSTCYSYPLNNKKTKPVQEYQLKRSLILSIERQKKNIGLGRICWIRLWKRLYQLGKPYTQVTNKYFCLTTQQVIQFMHQMHFKLHIWIKDQEVNSHFSGWDGLWVLIKRL